MHIRDNKYLSSDSWEKKSYNLIDVYFVVVSIRDPWKRIPCKRDHIEKKKTKSVYWPL